MPTITQVPKYITRFDGGISEDPRAPAPTMGSLIKHFDIFSNPFKLTPYRSTKTDTATNVSSTDAKNYDIRNFQLGSDGKLWGLGKKSGNPKIMQKADPTTGNWLASDGSNAATVVGEGNGAIWYGCFIEWQGAFWGFQGTNQVFKVLMSNGVITNTVTGTLGATITSVAQGVIANNTLYLFYNNRVVTVSAGGVVADNVFTSLPSDMRITSGTRFGAYLMIGMAFGTSITTITKGRSIVVQWDMNSTTTPSDTLDWGDGTLRVLGTIEGRVIGVSDKYLSSTLGLSRGSMVVRMWSGGTPQVMKEVVANQVVTADTATVTRFPSDVVIKNNKMYWAASMPMILSTSTESTYNLGIWCFGRKNVNSNFALTIDYTEASVSTSNFFINSIGAAGDYWFINHSADGSINSTDNVANFTATSIWESQILNEILIKISSRYKFVPDSSIIKELIGCTVLFEPLPANATVVLKYRIENETAYTQIFTYSTAGKVSHSAVGIENAGAATAGSFPYYREIVFRIESTNNAVITGFKFHSKIVGKDIYD